MIEIIYNKEKEKAVGNEEYFCIPKNIRQIGEVPKENKIYLEDYVYTYLTSDWKEEDTKGRIAILLGKFNWKNGTSYVFVKSAVAIEGIEVSRDHYPLSDTVWGTVYEDMKTYFPGQEVVGWYLSLPDGGMRVTDGMIRTHLKHFGGNDKVLLLADPYERESTFYLYKNNRMEKQNGYYVFYEKNDLMQEYMLVKNPQVQNDFSGKAQDRAVQDFRKIIARKQEAKTEKGSGLSWGIVACTGIAAISLAVGTFWLNSRDSIGQESEIVNSEQSSIIEETTSETVQTESVLPESSDEADDMVLLTPEVTATPENKENISDQTQENTNRKTDNENVADQSTADQNAAGQNTTGQNTTDGQNSEETAISVYTKYTVREGDTLSKISMRYYGDFSKITEICKINNMLEEDIIHPGQTILLP